MDADLQNDPDDIPKLITELDKGYDVVCGWRINRKDPLEKKVSSVLANWFRKKLTGEKIHDSGCTLRIYKRNVFAVLIFMGICTDSYLQYCLLSYNIGETPVNHRKRQYGKSKYGISRIGKGFYDLIFITFLFRFASRPLHIFGSIGAITFIAGFGIGFYLSYLKLTIGATLATDAINSGCVVNGIGNAIFYFWDTD